MDDEQEEYSSYENDGSYVCDSCGEDIVIPLDPTEGDQQSYIEDCPVCCNPNTIHVQWDDHVPRVWSTKS